jgi:hypothetical protein
MMQLNENRVVDRPASVTSVLSPTSERSQRNDKYPTYNEALNNVSTDYPNSYGSPCSVSAPLNSLGDQPWDFSAIFGTNPLGGWDISGMEIPFSTPTDSSDLGMAFPDLLDNAAGDSGNSFAHAQIPGFQNGGTNLNCYNFNTASALNFQEP